MQFTHVDHSACYRSYVSSCTTSSSASLRMPRLTLRTHCGLMVTNRKTFILRIDFHFILCCINAFPCLPPTGPQEIRFFFFFRFFLFPSAIIVPSDFSLLFRSHKQSGPIFFLLRNNRDLPKTPLNTSNQALIKLTPAEMTFEVGKQEMPAFQNPHKNTVFIRFSSSCLSDT